MILRPNVRYELTDGSQLLFADVKCEYKFIEVPQVRKTGCYFSVQFSLQFEIGDSREW